MLYQKLLRPILFKFDPEFVHNRTIALGEFLGKSAVARAAVRAVCSIRMPPLPVTVAGLQFRNPIGLAAGFDKDARLLRILPEVGFGFVEVGAVTRHPCPGNPGKRLLRLPRDKSIIVYYGLKNIGAEAVRNKLAATPMPIPLGVNIAKTNLPHIRGDKSIEDYLATYRLLAPLAAYVTLNISCPNTQDGCTFQDPRLLRDLLQEIGKEKKYGPIFLKISSHLSEREADAILEVAENFPFIDGFVIGNLAKDRKALQLTSDKALLNRLPHGGISGAPVRAIATNLLRYCYRATKGKYTFIGVGGIFTGKDAYEKILAGASLVQIITGLIYGGPRTVYRIARGLDLLLRQDGFRSVNEAVGAGVV